MFAFVSYFMLKCSCDQRISLSVLPRRMRFFAKCLPRSCATGPSVETGVCPVFSGTGGAEVQKKKRPEKGLDHIRAVRIRARGKGWISALLWHREVSGGGVGLCGPPGAPRSVLDPPECRRRSLVRVVQCQRAGTGGKVSGHLGRDDCLMVTGAFPA